MYLIEEIEASNKKMHGLILKAMEKEDGKPLKILPFKDFLPVSKPNIYANEYDECFLFKQWLDQLMNKRHIKNYTHIPNETYTESETQKRKNKELGVKPGVPDYFILTNKQLIVVEMKRVKGGVVSKDQEAWLQHFTDLHIPNIVANGFEEARAFVKQYI